MLKHFCLFLFLPILFITACRQQQGDPALQAEVEQYLDSYSGEFQDLYYEAARAEWRANTYIVEGDTATANAVQRANEALADFTGSSEH